MFSAGFIRSFFAPTVVALLALAVVGTWGGFRALFIAALLIILEITLSFDNAVVNAKVLKDMSEKWQTRFLTWGILLSVVVTRALLPIIIVAISTGVSAIVIAKTAFNDPAHYAELLKSAHVIISTFGGTFLTLVGLRYFLD